MNILLFQKSGIGKLIPEMVIDDYLFEPCGYSMNGIAKLNVSIFYWKPHKHNGLKKMYAFLSL